MNKLNNTNVEALSDFIPDTFSSHIINKVLKTLIK